MGQTPGPPAPSGPHPPSFRSCTAPGSFWLACGFPARILPTGARVRRPPIRDSRSGSTPAIRAAGKNRRARYIPAAGRVCYG